MPSRHIEFIGNSLTCGYGVEGKDRSEPYKAETENCNLSYATIIARYFNADYTLIAHSGRGVVRNYGDSVRISAVTMKDRMLNTFDMNLDKKWDFKTYKPDLVVVNLGTNDFSTNIYPLEDEFIHAYKLLISRLRTNYGDVPILCISPAIAQRQIVQYMERMRKDLNDKKVYIAVLPRRPLRFDYRLRSSMASQLQRSNENGYVIDSLYVNYHRMAIEKESFY